MAISPQQAKDDRKVFDAAFPGFVNDLVQEGKKSSEIGDAIERLKRVLEYNVPGGKKNRGLSVVGSLRHLQNNPTEEDVNCAVLLGWCIEWLQAFFLVADDIMDQSLTRRGKPCWYRMDDGFIALNDSIMIEATIYQLLKKHIRHKGYYLDVLDLFHEVSYLTATGQTLDLITKPGENFENFTLTRYKAIVKYKTAFYSFYLPVALAMYMNGIKDKDSHETAKTILLEMGEFFQIQDDFLDCYGDPAVTGKVGTDIEENKCSWLVVQALQRVSQPQLEILKENYGKKDEKATQKVKALYEELKLRETFSRYEEESYQKIQKLISEKSGSLPESLFLDFAKKIYKRNK